LIKAIVIFPNNKDEIIMLSKNKLMIAIMVSMLGLAACSESQKETAEEVEEEVMEMANDAKDKSADMLDSAKEGAEDLADDAEDAYDDAKESAEEMKDAAAAKIKEACIATNKKLGKSTDGC
jgi:F0F1-type ATP synthase membrane subunit b/b'